MNECTSVSLAACSVRSTRTIFADLFISVVFWLECLFESLRRESRTTPVTFPATTES